MFIPESNEQYIMVRRFINNSLPSYREKEALQEELDSEYLAAKILFHNYL